MTDEIARAMWFAGREEFSAEQNRLRTAIKKQEPLAARDWHRVLAATELAFISKLLGGGGDWRIVSGIDDHPTLDHIRAIQRKLAWVRPWPEPHARPGHEVPHDRT
jgi:hypothetical protein